MKTPFSIQDRPIRWLILDTRLFRDAIDAYICKSCADSGVWDWQARGYGAGLSPQSPGWVRQDIARVPGGIIWWYEGVA